MEKKVFGRLPSGTPIMEYTLRSEEAEVGIITLGGTIVRFVVSGTDVVLGWPRLEDYLEDPTHQGMLIGRFANRIRDARFTLNGKEYALAKNNGDDHHIHGGWIGFDRRIWAAEELGDNALMLSLESYDGEEGYPGNLSVKVIYRLIGGALMIDYTAKTDADTVCNLTNHAYFNLNGCGVGDVKDHVVQIFADRVTEVDGELLPTGEHPTVAGTPFDFLEPHRIGERVNESFRGYDHNYMLSPTKELEIGGCKLPLIAEVEAEQLRMRVLTDQPCMQFYTANFFRGSHPRLKGGAGKKPFSGFCMEAQQEPDSPNRGGAILRAGETYRQTTVYAVESKSTSRAL